MRLIDADALIPEEVHTIIRRTATGEQLERVIYAEDIDKAPTIDAVEVVMRLIYANEFKKRIDRYSPVRCKDCIYNKGEVNKKGFLICSANGMDITDDDYCSWGERMGEEE